MAQAQQEPPARYWWEWVAILLAIASLWPRMVLGWDDPVWEYATYVMLGVMILVAVRKVRRIQRLGRDRGEER